MRHLLIASACLLAALPAGARIGAGVVDIELRAEVETSTRHVRLGDVAYVRTDDLATIQRLVALPLGDAPAAGREAVLEREVLARWVRSRLGLTLPPQALRGAERAVVRSRAQVLAPERIEAAARLALERWLSTRATRFSIDAGTLPQALALPVGTAELKVRPLPVSAAIPARMVVWVDTWVDGAFVRTVPVSYSVEAYGEAWVAADASAAGVRPLLASREVRVSGQLAVPAVTPDVQTTRTVRAGEPLTQDNTRQANAVERGEWVALRFQAGGLQLEGRAQALQEGGKGQVVRVRMSGAKDTIEARVVERGRVEAMP